RKMVVAGLDSGGAQGGEGLVFIGKLVAIALVIFENHVQDGAGHKHNDRREHDGEPQSSKEIHKHLVRAQPRREVRWRLTLCEAEVKAKKRRSRIHACS